MIQIRCDGCGATVGAVWNYQAKSWRTPADWDLYSLWDIGERISRHACSAECREKLKSEMDEDPDVKMRRGAFKLVAGGKP